MTRREMIIHNFNTFVYWLEHVNIFMIINSSLRQTFNELCNHEDFRKIFIIINISARRSISKFNELFCEDIIYKLCPIFVDTIFANETIDDYLDKIIASLFRMNDAKFVLTIRVLIESKYKPEYDRTKTKLFDELNRMRSIKLDTSMNQLKERKLQRKGPYQNEIDTCSKMYAQLQHAISDLDEKFKQDVDMKLKEILDYVKKIDK